VSKKPIAIFTIVRNEKEMLPLWLRHYGSRGLDLFVLDHESEEGSVDPMTADAPFVWRKVTNPTHDDAMWMLNLVKDFQRELLESYEVVIYAEVDEFLVPDPEFYHSLWNYILDNPGPTQVATGFNLVWSPGDPPLDLTRPLLSQRRWAPDSYSCKPLIARVPLNWTPGFHALHGSGPHPDPLLYLVHAHYADPDLAWRRILSRSQGHPPANDGLSMHNKHLTRESLEEQCRSKGPGVEVPGRFRMCV
jgi:hypothetical protein